MAYFPNSSAGDMLSYQCDECILGNNSCPVEEVHLLFNYDQIGNDNLRTVLSMLVSDETYECQILKLLRKVM